MASIIAEGSKRSKKIMAYEIIKEDIVCNKIRPGTLLVERQICEALNTSRTPVREAIQRLVNENLVEFVPGMGAFVSNITYNDIIEIYDIRAMLEGLAAERCTMHIRPAERELMDENLFLLQEAVRQNDYDAFIEQDIKFHQTIVNCARNERLRRLAGNYMDQARRITYLIRDDEERIRLSLEHHTLIFNAIKANDPQKAFESMKTHLLNSRDYHMENLSTYKDLAKTL